MAKPKPTNPSILVDGVKREMTEEEAVAHAKIIAEAELVINAKKKEIIDKEIAVAKLVALGITESDLKAMGL